jgi:lysophospholipase L1-like esterase
MGAWPIPKRVTAVVVLILLGAGVAAWWYVSSSDRVPAVMIGDSMASMAKDNLQRAAREAGYNLTIDAIAGVTLAARLDTIQKVAAQRPPRVVIELGTNDVLFGASTAELHERIDAAVGYLSSVRCVMFVDVGLVDGPIDRAQEFNEVLRSAVAAHPNLHVYDWAADYQQHPDWTADGTHLQPQYQDNFAQGVIKALRSSCPLTSRG